MIYEADVLHVVARDRGATGQEAISSDRAPTQGTWNLKMSGDSGGGGSLLEKSEDSIRLWLGAESGRNQ